MKAYPIGKILTGVVVLFFACLGVGQEKTTAKYKNKEDCIAAEENDNDIAETCKGQLKANNSKGEFDAGALERCMSKAAAKRCQVYQSKSDIKDEKTTCDTAMDKYAESSAKAKQACNAFESEAGSTAGANCSAKVKTCEKKMKAMSDPLNGETESPEDTNSGYDALKKVGLTAVYQKLGISGQNAEMGAGGTCVKSIDKKALATEKKEKDRLRRELMDKIEQQKKDILKLAADLDEEKNKNAEKTNELNTESENKKLEEAKGIREETTKVTKETVNAGQKLRSIAKGITEKMQKLAQVNFTFQSQMLGLTDEKIKTKCNNQLQSLQAGVVNQKLASGGLPPDQQAQFAALAAQFKANGIKGSGQFRTLLRAAKKECFEQANTDKNQKKLVNAQAVETIQSEIDEAKKQMEDEKKNLATAQTTIQQLQKESDAKIQAAEKDRMTKLDNLSRKLENMTRNIEAKTQVANDKIKELTAEINNAMIIQTLDVEANYSEATEAIDKGNSARAKAYAACDCDNKESATEAKKTTCSQLTKDDLDFGSGGKKPTSRTSVKAKP